MKFYFFEIEIVKSSGLLGEPGSPYLICRAAASEINKSGAVFVLAYDFSQTKWLEFNHQITLQEAEIIVEKLERMGLPKRLPDVEGVHQTTKFWINCSLKIKLDDQRFYLDLSIAEGMCGQDAETLSELFDYLFKLAGYQT